MPDNAYIVEMDANVRTQVESLDFVRWVGIYHPVYKLAESLRTHDNRIDHTSPAKRYVIQVFEAGPAQKEIVADHIESTGGIINVNGSDGYLMQATLTPGQLGVTDDGQWADDTINGTLIAPAGP